MTYQGEDWFTSVFNRVLRVRKAHRPELSGFLQMWNGFPWVIKGRYIVEEHRSETCLEVRKRTGGEVRICEVGLLKFLLR